MKAEHGSWSAVLCIFLASLSGCNSPQSVRARPQSKVIYVVKDNYQAVYRQLLHRCRDRKYQMPAPAATIQITDEIWTDIKEASLALIQETHYPTSTFTFWVIDFKALDDVQTQATLYISDPSEGRVVQQWFAALGAECVSSE
jgi:hypothetical protein